MSQVKVIKAALVESIKSQEAEKRKRTRWIANPGVITKSQLGCFVQQQNPNRVKRKYLEGLFCIEGKYYLIDDVAERLLEKGMY